MAKQIKEKKSINTKRIQEIVNYDLSLGMLVNPNIKQQLVLNPIGAGIALSTLKKLREELDSYEIVLEQIDCNRIFGYGTELTESEIFVRTISDHAYYRNDYDKIVEVKELDKDFPRVEREKIANEIEDEIRKEYRKIETVGKLNKTLRRTCETKIEELSRDLRDILKTLEVPTEDYIKNRFFLMAESKIKEIKNRLNSKITYLENSGVEEIK